MFPISNGLYPAVIGHATIFPLVWIPSNENPLPHFIGDFFFVKIDSKTPTFREAIEELLTDIDYERVKNIYHVAVIGWEALVKEDPKRYQKGIG